MYSNTSRGRWLDRNRWSSGARQAVGRSVWTGSGGGWKRRHGRAMGTRQMIGLVRVGLSHGWEKLIGAVEEALRLGVSDEAAVIHILHMPDAEQRRRYAIALAEELREFEPPMPVMSEYDLLLHGTVGGVQ